MEWKVFGLALAISFLLWILAHSNSANSAIQPQYGIEKDDGSVETVLMMCDEMEKMKAIAQDEGLKRQLSALACGSDRKPECLPYYVQWKVLGDLFKFLEKNIEDNCKTH